MLIPFLAKRLLGLFVVLLVVTFLVFSLLSLSPGSPVNTLIGARPVTPALVASVKAEYHLNDPFFTQYIYWLRGAVQLNFGRSIQSGATVISTIDQSAAVSGELALYTLVLVLMVGIPAGVVAGTARGRLRDRTITTASMLAMSAPTFAIGIILIYVFGVRLPWFPVYGAGGSGFGDRIQHLTLPAITLASMLTAIVIRQTRAATLDVQQQDYVTFARARGVSPTRIALIHILRPASLPVVTTAGTLLIIAISGAVLVENVFSLPGLGSLMLSSVTSKNIPVVQGLALLVAVFVIVVNLLVDLLVILIDPRIRHISGRLA